MKLLRFEHAGRTRLGVLEGEEVADLSGDPAVPGEMSALLALGAEGRALVRAAIDAGAPRLGRGDVRLLQPVLRPPKILAVGLNYADHVEETGIARPEIPMIFNKQSTSAWPPFEPFHLPRVSDKLDYEGELGIVIGRRCRHVPKERAAEVIAGYTVVNDVSVRDWQMRVPTFTMGKSFDTHCPFGPWIVTGDELGDPHTLDLRTWVNGELRQESNTKHLIFDCFTLVEHLSTAFTLEPGDLIPTGTPSGIGAAMKPRQYLKEGDVVKVEIERIGAIEAAVVPEPASTALR